MKRKTNSQSQKKSRVSKESLRLRKLVHKAAKSDKTCCIQMSSVFGTDKHEGRLEKKKNAIAISTDIFSYEPMVAPGVFAEEQYTPPSTMPTHDAAGNMLVAGNVMATLRTMHTVLATVKDSFRRILTPAMFKKQEKNIDTIEKIVLGMEKSTTPSLKTYVNSQAKMIGIINKPKVRYAKVIEKIITV